MDIIGDISYYKPLCRWPDYHPSEQYIQSPPQSQEDQVIHFPE